MLFVLIFFRKLITNKFYDRSNQLYDEALLTRGYTQHVLRPYIYSEIYHKRYYIKISFINKGMDFIDLPCIFRDNSDISSFPIYFHNRKKKHNLQLT